MKLFSTTDEWKAALAAWSGIGSRPAPENRPRSRGFPVLSNGFLERYLGTSHWAMPGLWFIPLSAYLVYLSRVDQGLSFSTITLCCFAGVLAWTFNEYWLHRWLFHLPPSNYKLIREAQFMMHGYHHEFPNDPGRLVAPPALSWPIATFLGLSYWALFGVYWQALFAGTCIGYLGYDWIHYYTHHASPKTRYGKFMRRFHLEHHFKHSDCQFGLSSPLWDYVFFTFRKPAENEGSEPVDMGYSVGDSEARPMSPAGCAEGATD